MKVLTTADQYFKQVRLGWHGHAPAWPCAESSRRSEDSRYLLSFWPPTARRGARVQIDHCNAGHATKSSNQRGSLCPRPVGPRLRRQLAMVPQPMLPPRSPIAALPW